MKKINSINFQIVFTFVRTCDIIKTKTKMLYAEYSLTYSLDFRRRFNGFHKEGLLRNIYIYHKIRKQNPFLCETALHCRVIIIKG